MRRASIFRLSSGIRDLCLNRLSDALHTMSLSLIREESVERKLTRSALMVAAIGLIWVVSELDAVFLLLTPALAFFSTSRMPSYVAEAESILIDAVNSESTLWLFLTKLLLVPKRNVVSWV